MDAPTRGVRCPPWSRWREAVWLLVRGVTVRRCVPVALVVGFVLSVINQGVVIGQGDASWGTWIRVASNFVVPFLVSSYGFLAGGRRATRAGDEPPGPGPRVA